MFQCCAKRWWLITLFAVLSGWPVLGAVVNPEAYIKGDHGETLDYFGSAVAVSGDTMVVGSPGDGAGSSGAIYVFIRSGSTWTQQAYLKASNPDDGDQFGKAVAIDGDTIAVGAEEEQSAAQGVNGDQNDNSVPSRGAVYVFVRNGTTWMQQAYLKAGNDFQFARLGYSVAISGDTVVAGAVSESSAIDGGYGDGNQLGSGAGYVFKRNGTTWSQEAYLKGNNTEAFDGFGRSVGISGDTIIVGAEGESSDATSVNGDSDNNEASYSGAAYIFVRQNGTWQQQAYLKAFNSDVNDQFGWSVAISGDTAVVGALAESSGAVGVDGDGNDNSKPLSGAAYVFHRVGTAWSQQAYLKASNAGAEDYFGSFVSISGGIVVVGASEEDSQATSVDGNAFNEDASAAGAAYVYVRNDGIWTQVAYLKASNAEAGDRFGVSVGVSKNMIVVGALGESSAAKNINGDAEDNSAAAAGAAYVFTVPMPVLDQQSLMINDGQLRLSFESFFEANFSVLATGDLKGEWTVLGTAQKGPSGRYEFNDSTAGSVSSRFYRLRME